MPNRILALVFLVPGLNFLNNIHILTGGIYSFPWSYFFVQVTASLFAPLSYYYISLLTGVRHAAWRKWLIAISALLVGYGLYIGIHFEMKSDAGQWTYIDRVVNGPYPSDMLIYSALFFTHQLFYFSLNAIEVWQYRKEMIQSVSSLRMVKVVYLIRFTAILWLLTFITIVFYATVNTIYVEYVHLPLTMTSIFLFILYCAFNQHVVFTKADYFQYVAMLRATGDTQLREADPPGVKDTDESIRLYHQLCQIIRERELYRDPELTLQHLASQVQLPAYQVATAFRTSKTSFYETVRRIRVERAKEILADKHCSFTIEAIAYEVGFNSRSSFYRAFKKYEKHLPSAWTN